MTDEQYQELNKYLDQSVLLLKQDGNEFFVGNIEALVELRFRLQKLFEKYNFNGDMDIDSLSFEKIIALSRKVLSTISPDYLNEFDKLLASDNINFNADSSDIQCTNGNCRVNIHLEYNFDDIHVIVHEFAHYMSYKDRKKMTSYNYTLNEFFGIYFELYASIYLSEIGKIDCLSRIRKLEKNVNNLKEYDVLFLMFKKNGKIDKDTFHLMDTQLYEFSDEQLSEKRFEIRCSNLLNYFQRQEKVTKPESVTVESKPLVWKFIEDYRYLFCSYLAYYAYRNCNINDIIHLIRDIDVKIFEDDITKTLKQIGIDFTSDSLYDEALVIMEEFIKTYGNSNKVMK